MRVPIAIGKVNYTPDAPKGLPRWVWACECQDCVKLPDIERVHGPFKTRREAERDAMRVVESLIADHDGRRH